MNIKRITHVGIIVGNLEKSIEFYTKVLGLELISGPSSVFTDPSEGIGMGIEGDNNTHKHREAVLRIPDGNEIELIEMIDPVPVDPPLTAATKGKVHFSFQVEDIHECVKELKDYGVVPFSDPNECIYNTESQCVGYWVYMRDPDGAIFELQQL